MKRHGKIAMSGGSLVFVEQACECKTCRNFKARDIVFDKESFRIVDDPRIAERME